MPTSLPLPVAIRNIVHWNKFAPQSPLATYTPPLESRCSSLSTFSSPFFHSRAAVTLMHASGLQHKVRMAQPLHFYKVRITDIFYYHQPAGQNSKRTMPPLQFQITGTLGDVSSSDSCQVKLASGPLCLNCLSLSSTIKPRHHRTPMASTHLMSISLPPETPETPSSHMEYQTQSRIPWPSARIVQQSPLARQRMGFRIGTMMWNENNTIYRPRLTGQNASRAGGLNRLLKPSGRYVHEWIRV